MSYASLGRVDPDCYRACKAQNPGIVMVDGQPVQEHLYCSHQCAVSEGGATPGAPSSSKTLWLAAGAAVVVIGVGIFLVRKKR